MAALVLDTATPFLVALRQATGDYLNEALSVGGSVMNKAVRREISAAGSHNWGQRFVNGRRLISKNSSTKAFSMKNRSTGGDYNPSSLSSLVRNQLYPESHIEIIGLLNFKSFSPIKYRDGKAVGSLPRQKGTVTKHIGENMEYGGVKYLSPKQRRLFFASGIKVGKFVRRKPRPVHQKAFLASRRDVQEAVTKRFYAAFGEGANIGNYKITA